MRRSKARSHGYRHVCLPRRSPAGTKVQRSCRPADIAAQVPHNCGSYPHHSRATDFPAAYSFRPTSSSGPRPSSTAPRAPRRAAAVTAWRTPPPHPAWAGHWSRSAAGAHPPDRRPACPACRQGSASSRSTPQTGRSATAWSRAAPVRSTPRGVHRHQPPAAPLQRSTGPALTLAPGRSCHGGGRNPASMRTSHPGCCPEPACRPWRGSAAAGRPAADRAGQP